MAINAQEVIFVFPGKIPADLGRSSFSPNFLSQSGGAEVHTAGSCPSVPCCSAHIPIRRPGGGALPLLNLVASTWCLFSQTQTLFKIVCSDTKHIPSLERIRFACL